MKLSSIFYLFLVTLALGFTDMYATTREGKKGKQEKAMSQQDLDKALYDAAYDYHEIKGQEKYTQKTFDEIKSFIAQGAKVSAKPYGDGTCLHGAADNGHTKIIELFLEMKANVNSASVALQFTPLHCAAMKGHLMAVMTLIRNGADVNLSNVNGETPLLHAADEGHEKIVSALCIAKSNPNHQKLDTGGSALHLAIQKRYAAVADVLLAHKASLTLPNTMLNQSALYLAAAFGDSALATVLEKYKEQIDVYDLQETRGATLHLLQVAKRLGNRVMQTFFLKCMLASEIEDGSVIVTGEGADQEVYLNGCPTPISQSAAPEELTEGTPLTETQNSILKKVAFGLGIYCCYSCGKDSDPEHRMNKCGACGSACYCSKDCQRAHWPAHKVECKIQAKRLKKQTATKKAIENTLSSSEKQPECSMEQPD